MIYYGNIKTDKRKLSACYALIEQHRQEHNRVAAIARANPEKYLKSGKFRTYAEESKVVLKKLLAEQNRLKEKIRWTNYTLEQWKTVSRLDPEEQQAIEQTLFGNRPLEKVKPTKATSPLLDELKALDLDNLPESFGADPTEDLTTYTEVDPNTELTITTDKVDAYQGNNDETVIVYYDKGASHFDGNFEHLFKFLMDAGNYGRIRFWNLSNMIGEYQAHVDASEDLLGLWMYYSAAYGADIYLNELDGGAGYTDNPSPYAYSLDTVYYFEVERDEDVGTYGTLYAYSCTSNYYDDGGNLIETMSIALHTSKKDYEYIYPYMNWNRTAPYKGYWIDGYIELLDLQEEAPPPTFQPWAILM